MNLFKDLGLNEPLLKAITDMGFEKPSQVQEKTIPILLHQSTDIVSLAQTGTGKTAAFGFPLLQKIDAESKHTQAVVIAPTRELCLQITSELKLYSKYIKGIHIVSIYGGASIEEQARNVKKGAQILVATPGRMQDMIRRSMIDISNIDFCVLDEADEMLNMGFYEDITSILSHTPETKNIWLFSATMPKEVASIAKEFMKNPQEITVGVRNQASDHIKHKYYVVNGRQRYEALKRLVDAHPDIFSVVFCRTKRDTQSVAEKLIEDGYNAAALHGDLSQNQRDIVMKGFRMRQIQILVATDVAARGIDVDDITHVIHYQLPDEVETYTHRSGRTGRAGKSGVSMVILAKSELRRIKSIEQIIRQKFEVEPLPTAMEICEIQLYHLATSIKNATVDAAVEDYMPAIYDVFKELTKEELIRKIVAVEFNRFHSYYKNQKDLNTYENAQGERGDSDQVRYFINIGEKDGYDWQSLKDFLRSTLNLGKDDIFKVDVKNTFSFFNTDSGDADLVLETFQDFKMDGRFINVEISQKSGRERKRKSQSDRFKSEKKKGASAGKKSRKSDKISQVIGSSFKRKRRK